MIGILIVLQILLPRRSLKIYEYFHDNLSQNIHKMQHVAFIDLEISHLLLLNDKCVSLENIPQKVRSSNPSKLFFNKSRIIAQKALEKIFSKISTTVAMKVLKKNS